MAGMFTTRTSAVYGTDTDMSGRTESIAEGHESGADDSFHSSHNSSENKKDK